MQLRQLALLSCVENLSSGLSSSLEAALLFVMGDDQNGTRQWVSHKIKGFSGKSMGRSYRWISSAPTGWSRSQGWVPSLWHSAIVNYIASNRGSTSSTPLRHHAGPKARIKAWAMLREDHVRNLVAYSDDTAFVRRPVRAPFRVYVCDIRWTVSCGYAPNGEVQGFLPWPLREIKVCCTIAVVGESPAFKMIAAHQAGLARLPWHLSSLDQMLVELIWRTQSVHWLTQLRMAITISFVAVVVVVVVVVFVVVVVVVVVAVVVVVVAVVIYFKRIVL